MALPPAIAADLRQMLRAFRAAHGTTAVPKGAGKALEAWILLKLAQTASNIPGWTVTLCQGNGSRLPVGASFNLPDQRSRIQPSSLSAPCYVRLEPPPSIPADYDVRLELHGSVQWMGRSGALHECDVSVLPAEIGEAIRNNGGGYPHGLPIAAVECKDKVSAGTLDETRQTLARLFDLALVTRPPFGTSCRVYETNVGLQWGRRSSTYVSFFARGTFGIARAGRSQAGAQTLGNHYYVRRFHEIYDTTGASMNQLLASFQVTLNTIATF